VRLKGPAVSLIRFYQEYLSDLRYGRCRFEPSCSQYALEVIEERGLLVGSALAADRLVRCNANAWKYYRKGQGGRLSDPPEAASGVRQMPAVPDWLLPELPLALPVPQSDTSRDRDPAVDGSIPRAVLERIRDDARFADALAGSGDCYRAITEYKRVAFLGGGRDLRLWSQVKAAQCLYGMGDWRSAEVEFVAGLPFAGDSSERDALRLMVGASRFNAGDYRGCMDILDQYGFAHLPEAEREVELGGGDPSSGPGSSYREGLHQKRLLLSGFCSLAVADWHGGAAEFQKVAEGYPDSPYRHRAHYLAQRAQAGEHLRRRNPALAGGMSVVLPGLGQMYCGRHMDGLRHLVFNGILMYQVYRLIDHDNYPGAYLMAGIALPFYVGNVIGARRSAERFNLIERSKYLVFLMGGGD